MPRVVWKGAITFGLVHIPVNLYPGSTSAALDFDLLDKRDFAPIGYRRVNKRTGKEVDLDDTVKGYEYEDGRYVVMSEEDFRRANVKATQTVDIQAFVDAAEIPAYHFDTPYYLEPGKRGEKGYALLRETLRKTGAGRSRERRAARPPASCRGDAGRPAAAAEHPAVRRRDPACFQAAAARPRSETPRCVAQGARDGSAPRDGHDRALETGSVQGHLSERSSRAHPARR